jgi:CRP-like cAMP-binding protein
MPFSDSPNHFLASLSARDSELVRPHLKARQLPQGEVIYSAEDTIEHVYFPDTGVVSLVVGLTSGQFVEAGMLGRNSVVGAAAPLDGSTALNRAIVQVKSAGATADTAVMKRLVKESETLRLALVRNDQMASAQTQQVAACNALHELEERLSRWLLQTRDLVRSDTLPLTQEFLSQMLGVQRSSVTLVARKLQEVGLINYRRGRIHVLDVEGLHESCCECYAAINGHFHRLIGWTPDENAHGRRAAP